MPNAGRIAAALLLATLAASPVARAFGERDPGFASVPVKENGFCSGGLVAFDDGGALVAFAGWENGSAGLARLRPDGSIDTAWGDAGRVMGVGSPLVRTADGGLLAAQATPEGRRFLRLSRAGRVDPAYGTNGLSDALPSVTEAVLQPDGALVARSATPDGHVAFARLDPRGRLDAAFGSGGVLTLPLGAGGIRIYAWGIERGGIAQVAYHPLNDPTRPELRRFPAGFGTPDGAATDGRLVPRDVVASWISPRAKVQPDGALVIADMCNGPGACIEGVAMVARFDANGQGDPTFGEGGRTIVDILDPARGLSSYQAPVGLLAGERGRHTLVIHYLRHSGGTFGFNPTGLAAARLMADGSLDPAYPKGITLNTDPLANWAQLDDGRLLVEDALAAGTCKVARIVATEPRAEAVVVEYYRPDVDQYFMAPEGAETVMLDNMPAGDGWVRTGQTFGAWLNIDLPGATPICRFYGDVPGGGASHFFTPRGPECDSLRALSERTPADKPAWRFEGIAFRAREPVDGTCPANLAPVYRLYNDGFARGKASNHRYVTDAALYSRMQESGWIPEGVRFCVPPASRSAGGDF
jgi:uncharacterized delta-60 repeat protein